MKGVLPGLAAAGRGAVHLAKAALKPGRERKSGRKSSLVSSIRKRFNNNDKTTSGQHTNPTPSDDSNGGQPGSPVPAGKTNVNILGLSPAYMSPYVEDDDEEEDEEPGHAHKKHHGEDTSDNVDTSSQPQSANKHLVSVTRSLSEGVTLMFGMAQPSAVMGDFLDRHATQAQDYLDERETPPTTTDVCPVCQRSLKSETPSLRTLFRCQDCPMGQMMCHTCVLKDHHSRPFDRLRRWSPEEECWEKVSTADLGHVVYLGHGGACCPKIPHVNGLPDPQSRSRLMTVLHEHGLAEVPFVFCRCEAPINYAHQLLAVGLWPATWEEPETVITLTTLETFHNLSLQAQVNTNDYLEHLKRMTYGVLTSQVKVCIPTASICVAR